MSIIEEHLPIVEVVDQNISDVWPLLQKTMLESSFIAIDTEMTGLGDRKKLLYPELDFRYKYVAELARSHGTLSMGFSCYKCMRSDDTGQHYTVRTFDVLVLSESCFTVQADSLKFLLSHGFNFNKLVKQGLPYTPGNDPQDLPSPKDKSNGSSCNGSASSAKAPEEGTARSIFQCLVAARKPIVLHNGFVDLVFLYQHFYAELPNKLETFAANIDKMFPLGIYDTKYFSEFVDRAPASYLQFVYVKELLLNERCRQQQQQRGSAPHVSVAFPSHAALQSGLTYYRHLRGLHQDPGPDDTQPICESFSYHGWCKVGETCLNSHSVRRIVKELCRPGKKTEGNSVVANGGSCGRGSHRSGPKSTGTSAMLQSALRHNALYTNTDKQASKRAKVDGEQNGEGTSSRGNTLLCNGRQENGVNERLPQADSEQWLDGGSRDGANEPLEQEIVQGSNRTDKSKQNGNGVHDELGLFCGNSVSYCGDSVIKENGVLGSTIHGESRDNAKDMSHSERCSNGLLTNGTDGSSSSVECFTSNSKELSNGVGVNGPATHRDAEPSSGLRAATSGSDGLAEDASVKGLKRGLPLGSDESQRTSSNTSTAEGHSSGFDAFMTGFIFASYICQNARAVHKLERGVFLPSAIGLEEHVNKVYLMGKNFPFLVKTTPFSKPSNNHMKKMYKILLLYSKAPSRAPCSAAAELC